MQQKKIVDDPLLRGFFRQWYNIYFICLKVMKEHYPKIVHLKNGIKVWYIPNYRSALLNVGFWTLGGGSMETNNTLEYYHFLEHMVCDFTSTKYPDGRQNNKTLKTMGVDLQGEVDDDTMHIWMEGHERAADLMLDMLMNTILDYKLDATRFEGERESIITELQGYQNDPFNALDEFREKTLYKTHPIAKTLDERIASVKKATPESLTAFFPRAVVADRIIVYVSGNLPSPKKHLHRLCYALAKLPKRVPLLSVDVLHSYMPPYVKPGLRKIKLDANQTDRTDIVWKVHLNEFNDDYAIFDAFEMIFNTKLFDLLRIQKGLIYHVNIDSRYDAINRHISYFAIELEVNNKKSIQPTIDSTLEFIRTVDITETDLLQCKREETNRYEQSRLDLVQLDYAWDYVPSLLLNETLTLAKAQHNRFQTLSLHEIKAAMRKYLQVSEAYIFVGQ